MDKNSLITSLIDLTQETGEVVMSYYQKDIDSEKKSDGTPLTIVDQKAHDHIFRGLQELTPDIPILSEESEDIPLNERQKWNKFWLVDPIDGTRDFLEGNDQFCICIALIENHKPIIGLIYIPTSKTHYYSINENESFKFSEGLLQKISCRVPNSPEKILIGHHSSGNKKLINFLEKRSDYELTEFGSAIKFCLIAEGFFDTYPRFGPCSEWDTAAGNCILKNAGGSVKNVTGEELEYNTKDNFLSEAFIASNQP